MATDRNYTVSKRDDGGYTIDVFVSKRIWKLITAEGFFPKQEYGCVIDVIGEGEMLPAKILS